MALYDNAEGWTVEPGEIAVMVGASADDIRLEGAFTIAGGVRAVGRNRVLDTPVAVVRIEGVVTDAAPGQ
jgi:beta-glucosidase